MATAFSSETPPKQHHPQMVDLALEYARRGFAVFPLAPGRKEPTKGSAGVYDATIDEEQIRKWWRERPKANIAIAGGDGLVFIDRDTYKKDCADLTDWMLPPTLMGRSARGGTHHYFHYDGVLPCVNEGKLAPGICIKASGGYVVAPGSIFQGKRYEWVDEHQPIAELPERIAEMIRNATVRPEAVQTPRHGQSEYVLHNDGDAGAYWLDKALARTCDGQGDAIGFWLAQQLHIEARHGASVDVKATLRDYAAAATVNPRDPFDERDVERWHKSAERSRLVQNGTPARSRIHVVPPFSSQQDAPGEDSYDAPAQEDGEAGKETQQQVLLRIASTAHLFKTPTGDLFARVAVNGHYETWPIIERGSGFRRWLVHQYLTQNGAVPNATALTQAMEGISARAQFEGEIRDVYVRAAAHNGSIYLDLANDAWQIVEVSPNGWRVLDDAPVYFRRPASMLPLPMPVRGGSLDELRPTINVGNDSNWRLTVGWLLGTLHPRGPYPVLALNGERGSAKTDTTRRLRSVVDPAKAITRDIPKEARDLAIAANNSRVVALDNLSSMPGWFSDALCRLATGAGFATRALYTDDGEAIFDAARPIIFNGIEEVATRGDLLDRSIVVHLPTIEDNRCTAENLDSQFARAHPRILGALLDVVSAALRKQHTVRLERLPRMADFAVWATAAEEALGWSRGSFMAAYETNRKDAVDIELESHPVARAIIALMDTCSTWEGTAAVLLAKLVAIAGDDSHLQQWPKAANKLSGTIARLAPSLRSKGIRIDERRGKSGRVYTIERTPQGPQPPDGKGDDTQDDLSSPYRHQSPVSSPYRHPSNPLDASEGDDSDGSDDTFPLYSFVANKVSEEKREQKTGDVDRQGNLSSLSSPASQVVRLMEVKRLTGETIHPYTERMRLLGFEQGEAVEMFYSPEHQSQIVERHNRVFATAS